MHPDGGKLWAIPIYFQFVFITLITTDNKQRGIGRNYIVVHFIDEASRILAADCDQCIVSDALLTELQVSIHSLKCQSYAETPAVRAGGLVDDLCVATIIVLSVQQ